ncbi:MAG: addiction module protein, partial [Planctomycetota bacterium]
MRVDDIPEIGRLTAPEKILLVEALWDSIASEESNVPVPPSHREELDRRLADYKKDP